MREEKINDYIVSPIKSTYEQTFEARNVVLSKLEKEIFLEHVAKDILTDILERLKP